MGAEQDGPDGSKQTALDGYDSWNAYGRTRRMPWRTEPEIDDQRQTFLAERLAVKPDTEQGIYPFRDEQGSIRLTRADVESLVATSTSHDVYDSDGMAWHDFADTIGSAILRRYVASPRAALALPRVAIEFARWRKQQLARGSSDVQQQGLDLRGAHMKGEQLGGLPLARMRGGLNLQERAGLSPMQVELAAIHLEGAELSRADFRQAVLANAHLERGDLFECQFEGAILYRAYLDSVDVRYAHFAGVHLLDHTDIAGGIISKSNLFGLSLATPFPAVVHALLGVTSL
ncbi:MAG TPA: pentapeptide repeat-containing protein, partial [Ktedonobacterales bacterium]|nr:pentapeptide repeat-containing protein [Ktedonobacterales bacterium]